MLPGRAVLAYQVCDRECAMDRRDYAADLEAYKAKGIHVIRSFFSESVREDFARRAEEVIALRTERRLSTSSQDAQGLPYEWFEQIVHNPELVALMVDILGADIASDGCRILIKDKFFRSAVHVHQDWPYNPGDTNKAQAFIPLTRVNRANGGLVFIEESHQYGPVQRGSIDVERFPPMNHVCPEVEVGDLILADMLTWHYSSSAENQDERIMLQIYYQPSSDPSSNVIVSGKRLHDKELLLSRFDAMAVPSTELNGQDARGYLANGNLDRAKRWSAGLLKDDPDHVGAAVLLYDMLSREKDPEALAYRETARAAMRRLQAQIADVDRQFGLASDPVTLEAETVGGDSGGLWKSLPIDWHSYQPTHPHTSDLPAKLGTPAVAWQYGAVSNPLKTDKPATIRVRAEALTGQIGLCLISEDYTKMASTPQMIAPDAGVADVMLAFTPDKSPVRLLVRNHGDDGQAGEVSIKSIDVLEFG
jgi:hypothetical protein